MSSILMVAYTNYLRDPRVRREAETLTEAGHEVTFLARRQPGDAKSALVAGVRVRGLPGLKGKCERFSEYVFDYAFFFLLVNLHLLRHPLRYDLVHVNNMPDFLSFAAWLPRLLGRPVIHDVHDLMPEIYAEKFEAGERHWMIRALELQERWAGRFATAVLTVEERLKDILSERGVPRGKIHVLMNLPDDRIFAPRRALDESADRFVLVYHGTLARRLGLDVALRAVARIADRVPGLELRIIGAGEERDRLIALRDELGLGATVTFSDGFVPLERIPAMIEDASVGVVPLRISSGTDIMLPTKLLEYVLVGIPCVVPRTGTIARYFDDTMVQFFEAENVDSLAGAIMQLHADPLRRRALAEQATLRFANAHRWSEHRKVYTTLVSRLLDGQPATTSACSGTRAAGDASPRSSSSDDLPIPK